MICNTQFPVTNEHSVYVDSFTNAKEKFNFLRLIFCIPPILAYTIYILFYFFKVEYMCFFLALNSQKLNN